MRTARLLLIALAAATVMSACKKPATPVAFADPNAKPSASQRSTPLQNDGSLCEWKDRSDREASETAGAGSIQPNVRRVFQVLGSGDDRHKVLVCRETDTNFDGVKDVFRWYTDKGEAAKEMADANYDGKIDTWITFLKGRLSEERFDHNSDGNPDEWRFYVNGTISRAQRDTNFDGKPDVWEIYKDGALERMGVDLDGDEHVDRWDRDNELRRRLDEQERKKDEAEAAEAEKRAAAEKAEADKAEAEEAKKGGGKPKGRPGRKKK